MVKRGNIMFFLMYWYTAYVVIDEVNNGTEIYEATILTVDMGID